MVETSPGLEGASGLKVLKFQENTAANCMVSILRLHSKRYPNAPACFFGESCGFHKGSLDPRLPKPFQLGRQAAHYSVG